MDLNRITPIGRLGMAILAPRTVDEGESAKQVTSFRFAVNFPFEDHATWFTVECWGDLVDVVRKLNLKKGSRLSIEGKQVPDKDTGGPRAWIVEEGEKAGTAQAAFVIWANLVIALDGKRESANV